MPVISEEEDRQLIESFNAAIKLQEEVAACEPTTEAIIELYSNYYKAYSEHRPISKKILKNALSRIKNNELETQPLTTEEITELHRNLGIVFDKDGTILKRQANSIEPTQFNFADIDDSINNTIPELLRTLEALLRISPRNRAEINNIFQELYTAFGIKCSINQQDTITLQKIKFDSPVLKTSVPYKKYNIHFNNKNVYATRTNNIPLDIAEKKVLGKGTFGKVIRAIGYNQKDEPNSLSKLAIKKIILPLDPEALAPIVREINILKKLGEGGAAKRTMNKTKENRIDIEMEFKDGSPLNLEESSNLDFTKKIQLMRLLGEQIQRLHSQQIRHNDLKGNNIIVDYQNLNISLVDFGQAEAIDMDKPPVHETKGTPIYMAPEVISREVEIRDSLKDYLAADIYSLGKVFICDAGLHTLGIAYKMTSSLPTERPTIAEVISKLQEYQKKASEINEQEQKISTITVLEDKVNAIKELFDKHDICSKEYYNTLTKVLQKGTAKQLKIMRELPIFNHLFKEDPIAQYQGIYKKQNIPFENKMLELFTHAKQNQNAEQIALILLQHLCDNLVNQAELWCQPNRIANILIQDFEVALFVQNTIETLIKNQTTNTINNQLSQILKALSKEITQARKIRPNRPAPSEDLSVATIADIPLEPISPKYTYQHESDDDKSVGYSSSEGLSQQSTPTKRLSRSASSRRSR